MGLQFIKFTDDNAENGESYFGPFPDSDMHKRLNDAFAVALEQTGTVEAVSADEAPEFVNPPEVWIAEAITLEEEGFEIEEDEYEDE